ncbi:MAG: ArnT family glycosyltransferase [Pyrinomonadaceae bacterium]
MHASENFITTARLVPERFAAQSLRFNPSRTFLIYALALIVLVGFGFRVVQLGAESFGEDELNKLRAVEDYRAHGLTAANGEHPMLMKALMTASVIGAERWNATSFAAHEASRQIPAEAALRFPAALLGAFTSLLLFFIARELFGIEVGLLAAALWALDPSAIGFNRIAKEDTFFLFFFALGNVFWLRGQTIAESTRRKFYPWAWATAACFGAMMASKYLPHFLAISTGYYHIFQRVEAARWRMGKVRWLVFFAIMGAAFLLFNPPILLPATWHEMSVFAGEKRVGHDSYEFIGTLYNHRMTEWLNGVPVYFYFVFMGVKLSVPVLAAFPVGLALLFRKRLGDGRFFVLFWLMLWFLPFSLMGGKFTRYFTLALPAVLIAAAIGIQFIAQHAARIFASLTKSAMLRTRACEATALAFLIFPALAAASAAPHYRLYTNAIGGGSSRAGSYFPQDEFYDSGTREALAEVAKQACEGARVATETPELSTYYAQIANRADLIFVSLSNDVALRQLTAGDFIIAARGRRYRSNDARLAKLRETAEPSALIRVGDIPAIEIYALDSQSSVAIIETRR